MGGSINGDTQKWMVIWENPTKIDDLGKHFPSEVDISPYSPGNEAVEYVRFGLTHNGEIVLQWW